LRQVRHRIESLDAMLRDHHVTHPRDLLSLASRPDPGPFADLVYYVRKPMRGRFGALVAELQAQAALQRAAEAARGAAGSVPHAKHHHHHHHHHRKKPELSSQNKYNFWWEASKRTFGCYFSTF
jgi:hypothetical protein